MEMYILRIRSGVGTGQEISQSSSEHLGLHHFAPVCCIKQGNPTHSAVLPAEDRVHGREPAFAAPKWSGSSDFETLRPRRWVRPDSFAKKENIIPRPRLRKKNHIE